MRIRVLRLLLPRVGIVVFSLIAGRVDAFEGAGGVDLVEGFKNCALKARYKLTERRIVPPLYGLSVKSDAVKIREGYAIIPLDSIYSGMRINQLTIPLSTNTWAQYRLRIEALPSVVKGRLEKMWGVEFEESGPDGMDNAVGVAYRMLGGSAKVRVLGDSAKKPLTYIECNPA
jgi:hypothetical protein